MSNISVVRDAKEDASLTMGRIIDETKHNFPEAKYRPGASGKGRKKGISFGEHEMESNSDGIGTKPELAERLAFETGDVRFFESLAFDVVAMVADDAARDGNFVLSVNNNLDVNAVDPAFAAALARGLRDAANKGRFAVTNGETAELAARTPGVGPRHLNWNMTAQTLVHDEKLIDGRRLYPGQPIVGFREKSIRSNGLTRARAILERAFLQDNGGHPDRSAHMDAEVRAELIDLLLDKREFPAGHIGERQLRDETNAVVRANIERVFAGSGLQMIWDKRFPGNDVVGQTQLAWHRKFPELTEKLLTPSTIYAPLLYEAQGGVDGKVNVPIVANAHVSGGGVPLKGQRMIKGRGVGLHLYAGFPDPEAVTGLMGLRDNEGKPFIDNRTACEQWNRGLGFLSVVENNLHAADLVQLARSMGYEAAVIGVTTKEPVISWRGERWEL